MEEKYYKYGTLVIAVFTLLMLLFLSNLPGLLVFAENQARAYSDEQAAREKRLSAIRSMNGLDFLEFMNEQAREKSGLITLTGMSPDMAYEEALGEEPADTESGEPAHGGLRIELPPGVSFKDLSVENDYINKYVTLTIGKADIDYLVDYPMTGESGGIKNLSFANRSGGFVMQFEFDSPVEYTLTQDEENERFVYIDFVPVNELYDHIVVIDPGHGSQMVGAVAGDYLEKDINLSVVLYLAELFEQDDHGIKVFYTRTKDTDVSLSDRSSLANSLEADLFISVHCNSYSLQESVQGTQVLYDMSENKEGGDISKKLSGTLLKNVLSALQTKDMGVIDGSDKYILRNAEVPAAIVELGFMTNNTDLAKLTDEEYQKKCAGAIYDSIIKVLGV